MFLRYSSLLTSLARPEGLPVPQPAGTVKDWAQASAQLAMSRDLPPMSLSQRLSDPAAYQRLQQGRRQALEALLLISPDRVMLTRVIDLLCMIVEESSWSANPDGVPFDDEQHPRIDFQCTQTLMLLAWTIRILGGHLGSRITAKLIHEARRRVFAPILAHTDYSFMRTIGSRNALASRPLCMLSDILLSAILMETDTSRRGAVIKLALRLLDQAVGARERRILPLTDELAETAAVTDLCLMLRKLTRGEMDLTEEYPAPDSLDLLLFSWLEGDCFADPASGNMRPLLSGQELFRVGLSAGDEALTALGAKLHRDLHQPSATVTGRLLDLSCASMLTAEGGKPPRVKHAATTRNRLMLSRFSGMTCALHTGGDQGNAGSLLLFMADRPILVEIPGHACVPLVGDKPQLTAPGDLVPEAAFGSDVCPADFEVQQDREMMSVDLTHAWPAEAGVRACQRTAMVLRREASLRLVDAFDLVQPAEIVFRFITPEVPQRLMNGLRLGPVDLTWEGGFSADIEPLGLRFPPDDPSGRNLHCIRLKTAAQSGRAFYTFEFTGNAG